MVGHYFINNAVALLALTTTVFGSSPHCQIATITVTTTKWVQIDDATSTTNPKSSEAWAAVKISSESHLDAVWATPSAAVSSKKQYFPSHKLGPGQNTSLRVKDPWAYSDSIVASSWIPTDSLSGSKGGRHTASDAPTFSWAETSSSTHTKYPHSATGLWNSRSSFSKGVSAFPPTWSSGNHSRPTSTIFKTSSTSLIAESSSSSLSSSSSKISSTSSSISTAPSSSTSSVFSTSTSISISSTASSSSSVSSSSVFSTSSSISVSSTASSFSSISSSSSAPCPTGTYYIQDSYDLKYGQADLITDNVYVIDFADATTSEASQFDFILDSDNNCRLHASELTNTTLSIIFSPDLEGDGPYILELSDTSLPSGGDAPSYPVTCNITPLSLLTCFIEADPTYDVLVLEPGAAMILATADNAADFTASNFLMIPVV